MISGQSCTLNLMRNLKFESWKLSTIHFKEDKYSEDVFICEPIYKKIKKSLSTFHIRLQSFSSLNVLNSPPFDRFFLLWYTLNASVKSDFYSSTKIIEQHLIQVVQKQQIFFNPACPIIAVIENTFWDFPTFKKFTDLPEVLLLPKQESLLNFRIHLSPLDPFNS